MGFMFVDAVGTVVDEPRAKATVLMVVCKGDCNLTATVVRTKTDEFCVEMVLRFLSTYEDVGVKTHGVPSIAEIARRVAGQDNECGNVKRRMSPRDRSSGTCEWNGSGSTACFLS